MSLLIYDFLYPMRAMINIAYFCIFLFIAHYDAITPYKGGFFQKVLVVFQIPNLKAKIFQQTILSLKFKIPAHNSIMLWTGILKFKLRIVFLNTFFGDWTNLTL